MSGYNYQELAKKINERFNESKDAQVSVRTLKFWVEEGVLPAPIGSARWRFFDDEALEEAISIRKLQIFYQQGIEDIKRIISLARTPPSINNFKGGLEHNCLSAFISALWNRQADDEPVQLIKSFKNRELFLVYDNAYRPPYRLLHTDELSDSYVKKAGKVYRRLLSIKADDGNAFYFKPEQIGEYLQRERDGYDLIFKRLLKPINVSEKAEEVRSLLEEGILTSPRYIYKGENCFSKENIGGFRNWSSLVRDYGFSLGELKQMRSRIEYDIENYFNIPEISLVDNEPICHEFEKQVTLFDACLDSILFNIAFLEEARKGHAKDDSIKIIRNYLDGFLFLCKGSLNEIGLKKTPIERLSAEQIKTGLSQGIFTQREIGKVLKIKEAEVKTLKSVVKQNAKGGKHERRHKQ
ncbi:MAG: hypothetical protein CV087_21925 [Candidatus Brocadia sp. WS118]|nr:MAG: hypothetical protein CV087_21925 [Candidatus Brocadia sp. WS118]